MCPAYALFWDFVPGNPVPVSFSETPSFLVPANRLWERFSGFLVSIHVGILPIKKTRRERHYQKPTSLERTATATATATAPQQSQRSVLQPGHLTGLCLCLSLQRSCFLIGSAHCIITQVVAKNYVQPKDQHLDLCDCFYIRHPNERKFNLR
jgi:hypothetical protein